jgi:hypothetical protein
MTRVVIAAFVMALGACVTVSAQDGGPLSAAKDLYASARYDEALTVLNGLRGGDSVDRKSVEQYRSLCLLALGRANEAESAIAVVVTADPTYRPGEDTSPRVRSTFADVRRRLLPDIAQTRYVTAKSAYDRKDWAAAEHQFRVVLSLIEDPDTGGKLSDLRVLTVGFLELSARAAAPPPEPKPEPQPAPAAAPPSAAPPSVVPPVQGSVANRTAVQGPVPNRTTVQAAGANPTYGADDHDVVPPGIVRQDIPAVPPTAITMARPRGLLEVVVDERGRVVGMAIRASIHPTYDALLLAAARDWKYKPATLDGQPVKYRKLIQVTVKR